MHFISWSPITDAILKRHDLNLLKLDVMPFKIVVTHN